MSNEACDCCGATPERSTGRTATPDRWLGERPVGEARLPPDVAEIMSRFYGAERVATLDDFVAATRAATGGGAIDVDELCHVEGETPHRATTVDETYHFRCFFDGIALAHLVDEPVDIRTESPAGTPVEMHATSDGDVDATPSDTVMSLGIAADAEAPDDEPTPEAVYEAVCPYVKAFPSRDTYESWAAGVDAATIGMPLAAGVPVAAALAE